MQKISVIVPVYNLQNELQNCIASILKQSHSDVEIIIVDDGSKDKSRDVIERLAKEDTRIVPLFKSNGGVTSARLAGIRVASGDWIGFVDGDDEIEPNMFELLLNNALQYNAQISHCGYQMRFSDGRVNYFYNTGCLEQQDRITALKELLSGARFEPGLWNKLFHKNLFHGLLHSDLMDRSIKINEDLLMNFYLFLEAERSVYQDVCPYHYIVRSGSASRQSLNKHHIYDPIRVKERILKAAPEDLIPVAKRVYLSTCINVYSCLVSSKQPEFKSDHAEVRQMIKDHYVDKKLLSSKQQLLARIIVYTPWLYKPVYRFYAAHLQRNPYV